MLITPPEVATEYGTVLFNLTVQSARPVVWTWEIATAFMSANCIHFLTLANTLEIYVQHDNCDEIRTGYETHSHSSSNRMTITAGHATTSSRGEPVEVLKVSCTEKLKISLINWWNFQLKFISVHSPQARNGPIINNDVFNDFVITQPCSCPPKSDLLHTVTVWSPRSIELFLSLASPRKPPGNAMRTGTVSRLRINVDDPLETPPAQTTLTRCMVWGYK